MADTELVKKCEQIQKENIQKAIENYFISHPGLTKKEFGEVFGIEERSAGRYLDGNSTPQGKYYLAMCEYMNISPNELFGYDESKQNLSDDEKLILELYKNNTEFKNMIDAVLNLYKKASKH